MVAVLGAAAVVCFVFGLWLPLVDAERGVARRLRGFVQAPIGALEAQLGLPRHRGSQGVHPRARRSSPMRFIERVLAEAESDLTRRGARGHGAPWRAGL